MFVEQPLYSYAHKTNQHGLHYALLLLGFLLINNLQIKFNAYPVMLLFLKQIFLIYKRFF